MNSKQWSKIKQHFQCSCHHFVYVWIQWFIVTRWIHWFPKNTMTYFPVFLMSLSTIIIWLLVLHLAFYSFECSTAENSWLVWYHWIRMNEFHFPFIEKTRYLQTTPVNNAFIEWNSFLCFFLRMLSSNLFLNNDLFSWLNLIHRIGVPVLP